MNCKILNGLAAVVLGTALGLASPALAQHGGGGGGMSGGGMSGGGMSGGGGGMSGGGMGSGMSRGGGGGAGMHPGGMAGGMQSPGGGTHFGAIGGRTQFGDGRFARESFAHRDFSPRFSRFADRDGFHHRFFAHRFFDHRFFHHRFHRFAFAGDDGCLRRVWTPRGPRFINICG
ncbi:hypothetical protein MTX26_17530 [Bradyrhizobium sp. ISRA443]|nr:MULTISPECIES: hypothetical protein [unclassified Bradyrhizobium]WGR92068.1 hypothetical protein MTX20_28140 [Bradyrhizobium sp. ISRA435]WGS02518.1 hypothetical protein MTX23_17540 [Bradyrhizobium sp. ISRA436]WGS09403.1 hypothetical protein MTX18_17530 [Bradyrhizobium sp. ISRA437]WGS16292.1 hypothetical protein MTX26_17530 [Bradyrhizobium sp. ISRA443]